MKANKNPKVVSEGILWMVTAVDDIGISNLKLKQFPRCCRVGYGLRKDFPGMLKDLKLAFIRFPGEASQGAEDVRIIYKIIKIH
ncbi:hypothetical protein RND71_035529 [Anisodus tanguticus]|uniref:Uncharacterized protein n=1 Tax=Anisodus tanguticus TaxID=243964 RepID=A0AAE1UUJ4_9SOLA|nr:hypothetical protein RND71_035529 [Anisodus tanguticus]